MKDQFVIHCLQILSKVFSYLPTNELLNSRRVCRVWNGVVIEFYSSSFVVQLKKRNNAMSLAEYIEIASNSAFCKAISNYSFSLKEYPKAEVEAWKAIFEKFGSNIKSLTLSAGLNKGIVELIFCSDDIQKYLKNLTKLYLNVSLDVPFVAKTKLNFLVQLKHLTVAATEEISEYGQIEFLTKFLKLSHKLESIVLHGHYCIGELPSNILQNLFRTNTIESLEVTKYPAPFLDDDHVKSMTTKKNMSKLKSIKFDAMRVTSTTFHQFLVSHRQSLEKISIQQDLLEHYPTLERLTHLDSRIAIGSNGLSFCTQFSNLKVLKLNVLNEFVAGRYIPFEHKALRLLYLESSNGSVISLIAEIPSYFPNLRKLELRHRSGGILPLKNFGKLQHQIRYVFCVCNQLFGMKYSFWVTDYYLQRRRQKCMDFHIK